MEFNPIIDEKTILVVDDSNITRNLIEHVYKDKYKVMMASDGKQAMDVVDTMPDGTIMAILLDLNSNLFGKINDSLFGVLDYFQGKGILEKVPVCIITGEEAPEIIGKVRTYNVAAILLKPFSVKQIEDVVTKAIELRKNS